ncbi:helix-turn-helix domain-containing protein [Amycolatopsis thermoflava]|uniref:helix-turn-helix domain-containing protein n=1 Tax=Amycolatopsis thermoflava TaxID=84480 RepID=UPI0038101138
MRRPPTSRPPGSRPRRLLESTDEPLDRIAAACGLGSVETLHRAMRKQIGTTPAAYRRRFRTTV